MRKSFVLAAFVCGLVGIGGTGHAAPRIMLPAQAADRCAEMAGVDLAACRSFETTLADAARIAALAELSKAWRGPRLAAFARLVAAEQAFARTLAADETGAAPGSTDAADAEQAQGEMFVATLRRLVAGRLSPGDGSLEAADGALNDTYGRVMDVADPKELGWGDVEKAGILRTERAWLAYRDAFAAFAGTLGLPKGVETIERELTRQRAAGLDAFLGD